MNLDIGKYSIEIEAKWQKFWQEKLVYDWQKDETRENTFVIDTPPPTISGSLHIGHIMSYTQTDFIARYQRMRGKNVFYPIGFDGNGLPTERLVEKTENIRASNMSRKDFINICTDVVKRSEEDFRNLFKSIALSVDWSQEYQTISNHSRRLSQLSFLELLKQDKAYRKLQHTLWDPVDQTALAQADIVDKEQKGLMNDIIFVTETDEKIIIATTRPELLPACVAIFYNPEDSRYQHLNNQFAITPLFGIKVPILADKLVDIDKGTGLVMCCTFGDTKDVEWWKNYNLALKMILDKSGRIIELKEIIKESTNIDLALNYASQIVGLKIKDARIKIIELLKVQNLIIAQKEVEQMIKSAERSGAHLEILITPQWFIKLLDNTQLLLDKANQCNWYPNYMKLRLESWINGLSWDWCISRQRFFGVPFPIWYSKRMGEEGKILTPTLDQLPVDPFVDLPAGYSREEVEPDFDVMDTWATSSISPQLNSYAITKDCSIDYDRHTKLFPADLRPQAHEIIRTWAFYTIVKSAYHEDNIPWKNLMISGWCLAADKTKMSKSKNNVITPNNLIKEYGADVIRYWTSNAKLGADTTYSEEVILIGKKLVNKIWNAAKFVKIHLSKLEHEPLSSKEEVENGNIYLSIDLWALSNLSKTIKIVEKEFDKFEYCNAKSAIENYFWNVFCDNYLEIIKVRIYDENDLDNKASISAIKTLYICLNTILKLFAPFLPHVTEEIYHSLFDKSSIHRRGSWPDEEKYYLDTDKEILGNHLVNILNIVRKFKAEKQISPKMHIEELIIFTDQNLPDELVKDLSNVTNAKNIIINRQIIDDITENLYITEDKRFSIKINL